MMAFLLTPIARWIMGAAVVALLAGGLYVKGRVDGNNSCIAKNAAQVQKMESYVRGIRSKIERNQRLDPADLLRDDPFIRPGE